MKTIKFIIAALLLTFTVYSCSAEREEENVQQSSSPKLDIKKLKTSNNQKEAGKVGDSVVLAPNKANDPADGVNQSDPNAPNPVVDPTKPDKPW
ncbi:hypothetical protein [Chryseobacterium proteolyticum]|uniref:hypothetical protein n=1 Tax=Chryseobacterium proteolyticum TaxID=118127 RepID=UPI003982FF53